MEIKFVFLITLISLFAACSASEESAKRNSENYSEVKKFTNEVNLDVGKNVSWINSMPGSQPKFHVSGKVNLLHGNDYDPNEMDLMYIKIYQGAEELYYIIPKVIDRLENEVKSFTFSTIKGLSINEKLDREKPVMFELIFMQDKSEYKYRINNVTIEEVF